MGFEEEVEVSGPFDAAMFRLAKFASKTVSYRFRASGGTGVGRARAREEVDGPGPVVEVDDEEVTEELEEEGRYFSA